MRSDGIRLCDQEWSWFPDLSALAPVALTARGDQVPQFCDSTESHGDHMIYLERAVHVPAVPTCLPVTTENPSSHSRCDRQAFRSDFAELTVAQCWLSGHRPVSAGDRHLTTPGPARHSTRLFRFRIGREPLPVLLIKQRTRFADSTLFGTPRSAVTSVPSHDYHRACRLPTSRPAPGGWRLAGAFYALILPCAPPMRVVA